MHASAALANLPVHARLADLDYLSMAIMKLHIKYMVSARCITVVKSELDKLGIEYGSVDLGEVVVKESLAPGQYSQLQSALLHDGLELMEDRKAILIEKIKHVIIEMIQDADELPKLKNSSYIAAKLNHDYTYLANLFSEVTGTTIEHYIIAQKIEKAKELLLYNELNLTEISYKLNYSSVAHLSNQFKKVTGLTPTFFKKLRRKRISLDKL